MLQLDRKLLWGLAFAGAWIVAGVSTCSARRSGETAGALREQLRETDRDRARWQDSAAVLAARYRVDTVRVTTTRTRYRTLRDSALASLTHTDSARSSDTSAGRAEIPAISRHVVARAFAACDTTIAAGAVAISTCERRIAAADSIAALERNYAKVWRGIAASRQCRVLWVPCPSRGVMLGAGVVLGAAGAIALQR